MIRERFILIKKAEIMMAKKKKRSSKSKKKSKRGKTPAVIELKKVWKIYKMGEVFVNALKGVDLQIKKGSFVAITGPSGSGKSTMMNLVGCLDLPSKGSIFLDGMDISELEESDLAQIRGRKIGFIFQQFNLIPTLSALENVMLPMIFQNAPEDERMERAKDLLKMVELDTRMHHKPSELSGGQRQRVAIARSLANDPEIILADEPTGNLDSKTGKIIMELLRKLNRQQEKTVILVTHDLYLTKYATKKVHIKDGEVVKEVKK